MLRKVFNNVNGVDLVEWLKPNVKIFQASFQDGLSCTFPETGLHFPRVAPVTFDFSPRRILRKSEMCKEEPHTAHKPDHPFATLLL